MSVTFLSASRAQRHIHDLIAFVRILIALPCPCLHSCRRVATPRHTRVAVSATFLSASCFRRRVHGLVAIVRILIAVAYPRTTSCRRVAAPRRARAAVSVMCMSASRAQRHVRGLVAFVRILIALSVSAHDLASACRHAPAFPRRHVRDARVGVTLSRQARRHVHDLIAFFRVMIAVSCPHLTLRGRVAML